MNCNLCPRKCNADRSRTVGFCGCGKDVTVAKAMLHMWEEPCISGTRGSGAVFFSGCNLRCSYCQNRDISRAPVGEKVDAMSLAAIMHRLEKQGAHNINLVTAAHFLPTILDAIELYKKSGGLPVIYNTSAYETAEAVDRLSGLVDVFLPDLKYHDSTLSEKYSSAPDYNEIAVTAIDRMVSVKGEVITENGLIKGGVIIRHLVLPAHKKDSERVLRQIAQRWGGKVKISLMRQYTPEFASGGAPTRRVTSYEYNSLLALCKELKLDGYFQSAESATVRYTPDFHN